MSITNYWIQIKCPQINNVIVDSLEKVGSFRRGIIVDNIMYHWLISDIANYIFPKYLRESCMKVVIISLCMLIDSKCQLLAKCFSHVFRWFCNVNFRSNVAAMCNRTDLILLVCDFLYLSVDLAYFSRYLDNPPCTSYFNIRNIVDF